MIDHSECGDLNTRIASLEGRVAEIEQRLSDYKSPGCKEKDSCGDSAVDPDRATSLLRVEVSEMNLHPADALSGVLVSYLRFDIAFHPEGLTKPTRCVKGALEFADLFGDVQFMVSFTINERIEPGQLHVQEQVGFQFSEFVQAHVWVQSTPLVDMRIAFRVHRILYEDGTEEAL